MNGNHDRAAGDAPDEEVAIGGSGAPVDSIQVADTTHGEAGNVDAYGNYLVGKGRPPTQHQFRKNDGRPRGRRAKGTKNLKTDLLEVANEKVSVTENGHKKSITKQRATVLQLANQAAKGHIPAIRTWLDYLDRVQTDQLVSGPELSAVEQAILADLRSRIDFGLAAAKREEADADEVMPEAADDSGA